MNKDQLASSLLSQGVTLFKEDANGRPAYKSPSVVIATATTALETVGSFFGYPGVGSAIAVILSAIFRKKIDRLGTSAI